MFGGLWRHKENILYVILTIFLLERVRRGWNRIEAREAGEGGDRLERRQQTFLFGAASLYALPFLLPLVRYIYRSIAELGQYVSGLDVISSLWVFALILVGAQAFLSIVLYNLLGIYVERMNRVTGAMGRLARNLVATPRLAAEAGASAGRGVVGRVKTFSRRAGGEIAGLSGTAATHLQRRASAALPRAKTVVKSGAARALWPVGRMSVWARGWRSDP